jgi:hypothetical protein
MGLKAKKSKSRHADAANAAYAELIAYVEETAAKTDGWEGELLDAAEVNTRHGIGLAELEALHAERQVVAFGRKAGGFRYPDAQFENGKVVSGLDRLVEVVRICGEMWLWLRQPCPYLEWDIPLDLIKRNEIDAVLAAAHKQYDPM